MVDEFIAKLANSTDVPLLSWGNSRLTAHQFVKEVDWARRQSSRWAPSWVVLHNEDPLKFYSVLIGLWKAGHTVVFPTRDYLAGTDTFGFAQHVVKIGKDGLILETNENYRPTAGVPTTTGAVVFSSGSTGTPKGICHPTDHLLQNARSVSAHLGLREVRSITPLKPYLVSALSHFLVHALSGSELRFVDNQRLTSIADAYQVHDDWGIVGSPIHVTSAMPYVPDGASPRYFFTSGDFMYQSAIAKIFRRFPLCTFFKVYGLAELGGRFFVNTVSSDTKPEEFEALGQNIQGTIPSVRNGELFVDSDMLFLGYLRDGAFHPSKRPHATGDLIQDTDHGVLLCGRTNDEIKVGGNKVSLRFIESKISRQLSDYIVVLVATPHDVFGNMLSLVVKTTEPVSRHQLMTTLAGALERHEMPHFYYRALELPHTQSQKVDRKRLVAELHQLERL